MKQGVPFRMLGLAALILAMAMFAQGAYRVTKATDSEDGVCDADCSLREAVQAATDSPVSNVVDFSPALSGSTIVVSLGEIRLNNVRVVGFGAKFLTVSGNHQSRIFYVTGTNSVIAGLTLTAGNGVGFFNGSVPGGGAVRVETTALLQGLHFTGNEAIFGGGAFFDNGGTLVNSTFSSNTAFDRGSSIWLEAGGLSVFNSTFVSPGPIGIGHGTVAMRNSTAPVDVNIVSPGGAFTFGNSIVGHIFVANIQGVSASLGTNIVIDSLNTGTGVAYAGSDKLNVNPLLGTVGDNGGKTPTIPIGAGSPALDAANNTMATSFGITYDQRRFIRIVDGNGDGNVVADIGAFEYGSSTPVANTTVSGTISDGSGRPVQRATVTITDLEGNTQTTSTNPFGVYGFTNVAIGMTFFSVEAKGHRSGPAQIVAVPGGTTFNITVQ